VSRRPRGGPLRPVLRFALLAALAAGTAGPAAALDDTSLAPAWVSASQADKDAWIASFKFEAADADRPGIADCLDRMAKLPPFETNKLSGVTSMCETAVARGGM
jgi:hypothetical protein